MNRNKILILCLCFLLAGLAAGVFSVRYLWKVQPRLVCGNDCQNVVTTDRKFFADELILSGMTKDSEPFLLRLDLNRKKLGATYQHYYFADLVYGPVHRQLYTAFLNDSSEVQPKDFLASFSRQMASDLSARESYRVNFEFGDIKVSASMQNFSGDFLVKNTLEYTKYVSTSNAQVTVNGQSVPAEAALAKIYTPDYSKYVFFDGYESLESLAQFFTLWDEQGNFYLLDQSDVTSQQPDYTSHTWVLYKHKDTGFAKKAFSASVNATAAGGIATHWNISIPELNATLDLSPLQFVTSAKNNGVATGTVTLPQGSLKVQGFFSYNRYGQ